MMFGELGPADGVRGLKAILVAKSDEAQKYTDKTVDKNSGKSEFDGDDNTVINGTGNKVDSVSEADSKNVAVTATNELLGIETPQSINVDKDIKNYCLDVTGKGCSERVKTWSLWGNKTAIRFVRTELSSSPSYNNEHIVYSDFRGYKTKSLCVGTYEKHAACNITQNGVGYSDDNSVLDFSDQFNEKDELESTTFSRSSSCLLSISDVDHSSVVLIDDNKSDADRSSLALLDDSRSDDQSVCDCLSSFAHSGKTPVCDFLEIFSSPNDNSATSLHLPFLSPTHQAHNNDSAHSESTTFKNSSFQNFQPDSIGLNVTPDDISEHLYCTSESSSTEVEDDTNISQGLPDSDVLESKHLTLINPNPDENLKISSRTIRRTVSYMQMLCPNTTELKICKRDHSLAYSTGLENSLFLENSRNSLSRFKESLNGNRRCSSPSDNSSNTPTILSPPQANSGDFCSKDTCSPNESSPSNSISKFLSPLVVDDSYSSSDQNTHRTCCEDEETTFGPSTDHSVNDESPSTSAVNSSPPELLSTISANELSPVNKPLYLDISYLNKCKLPSSLPAEQGSQVVVSPISECPISSTSTNNSTPVTAVSSKRSKSATSLNYIAKNSKSAIKHSESATSPIALSSRDESLQKILVPELLPSSIDVKVYPTEISPPSLSTPNEQITSVSNSIECPTVDIINNNSTSSLNESSTSTRNIDNLNPERYLIDAQKHAQKSSFHTVPSSRIPKIRSSVEEALLILKKDNASKGVKVGLNSSRLTYAVYIIENLSVVRKEERRAYCKTAVGAIKKLAFAGSSNAQYQLGNIYMSGVSCPADNMILKPSPTKGFSFYVSASKQMHHEALFHLGMCYEEGMGVQRSYVRALFNYKKAAMLNHPGALFRLGMCLLHGELRQPKQPKEGVKWLKLAVKYSTEKYPHALYQLAMLHEKGFSNVIWVDHAYLIQLLSKAATLNHVPSQYLLGETYEYGNYGIDPDPGKSVYYYSLAAANGSSEAMFELGGWYLTGAYDPKTNFSIPQSDTQALDWVKLSAMANLPKGMYTLGYFYELGIGCAVDLDKSKYWYSAAAKNGDSRAKRRIETEINFDTHEKRNINTRNNSTVIRESLFARSYTCDQSASLSSSSFEKRTTDNSSETDTSLVVKSPNSLDKNNSADMEYLDPKESSYRALSTKISTRNKTRSFGIKRKNKNIFTSPIPAQATPSPPLTESAMNDFSTQSTSLADISPADKTSSSIVSPTQNSNTKRCTPPSHQNHLVMISPKSDTKLTILCPTMSNSASKTSSSSKLDEFLNHPCDNISKLPFGVWSARKKSLNINSSHKHTAQSNKTPQACIVS